MVVFQFLGSGGKVLVVRDRRHVLLDRRWMSRLYVRRLAGGGCLGEERGRMEGRIQDCEGL